MEHRLYFEAASVARLVSLTSIGQVIKVAVIQTGDAAYRDTELTLDPVHQTLLSRMHLLNHFSIQNGTKVRLQRPVGPEHAQNATRARGSQRVSRRDTPRT